MTTLQVYATKFADDFEVLDARYESVNKCVQRLCEGKIRSLVVRGAPGVGKSYSVGKYLKQYAASENNVKTINGKTTIAQLYQMLYLKRNKGDVLVLDDSDSVYESIEGLSLLKAAMDTCEVRNISWETKRQTPGVPNSFEFNGSIVLITNTGFSGHVNKKQAAHLTALLDRTFSIQVSNDGVDNCFKQVCYMVIKRDMLKAYNFSDAVKTELLDFIDVQKSKLATISLRTLTKLADLYVMEDGKGWKELAMSTLTKAD